MDAKRRHEGRNGSTPTVLLVHDAFADTSIWAATIAACRPMGTDCVAVANPLRGLRTDAEYVAAIASLVDGPVVLVGHGYGGAVASVASAWSPNVRGLAFVAGLVPDLSESCVDILRQRAGSPALLESLCPRRIRLGSGDSTELTIDASRFATVVAQDVAPDRAAVLASCQRPIVAAAFEEPAPAAGWRDLPVWYLATTANHFIDIDVQVDLAARAGATTVQTPASHWVAASRPQAVAELIAAATAR